MIPKTLHLCWLSGDPFPADIQRYIDTWRQIMPDYKIKKWDFSVFPRGKSRWVDQAFDSRKYAFAADYIRNYALFTEGGIYLDADVEVLKSFDPLLHLPYFMGYENGSGCIEAAVLGAEPGNPIFKTMLEYYDGHEFINLDGSLNTTPLPQLKAQLLNPIYKFEPINDPKDFDYDTAKICILPYDYFSPIHHETKRLMSTSHTMVIHHFAASWATGWPKYRNYLKQLLGPTVYGWAIKAKRFVLRRDK